MIVNGNALKNEIKEQLRQEIINLGFSPRLGVLYIGHDPVIEKYISIKEKFAIDIGAGFELVRLPEQITTDETLTAIQELSARSGGIIIQLPLPRHLDQEKILLSVPKEKDVDLLSQKSKEHFESNDDIVSPVVGAIALILTKYIPDFASKKVAVVGQGKLVGSPVLVWLMKQGATPAVITRTMDMDAMLSEFDIIISGAGSPGLIKPSIIKEGVVIIDAGTAESDGQIQGDADPLCAPKCSIFTPVPGGIGPLTVAMLYKNLVALSMLK